MKSWKIDGREFRASTAPERAGCAGAIPLDLHDTHAHFCRLSMTQSGVGH
jgi:hypothetical protein